MSTPVSDDRTTIDRLLDSAQHVFAEKGFRGTTIKDICEHADANIAAVNYHFGSKEELYSEAWKRAFKESLAKHPPDGGVPEDAPPEERLRGRIRSLVKRISDPEHPDFLFAYMEIANPTPLGEDVVKDILQPLIDGTIELLRELLGPDVSEQTLEFCERSIVSQCLHLLHLQRKEHIFAEDEERETDFSSTENIDEYAEHVYQFSLAGIRSIREQSSS